MTWAKLDDRFYSHPKVAGMDHRMLPAVGLHCLALSWCSDQLTDGFIPEHQVVRLTGAVGKLRLTVDGLVAALLDAGLWEPANGGYQIHDYLEYNRSKEDVLIEREQTRARVEAFRVKREGGKRTNGNGDVTPLQRPYKRRSNGISNAPVTEMYGFPVPGVPTVHREESAVAPDGAGTNDSLSAAKRFAMHFFDKNLWLCCGLPPEEEHALREGLTNGTITREQVASWQ